MKHGALFAYNFLNSLGQTGAPKLPKQHAPRIDTDCVQNTAQVKQRSYNIIAVAQWLERRTRDPMISYSVGSKPGRVD